MGTSGSTRRPSGQKTFIPAPLNPVQADDPTKRPGGGDDVELKSARMVALVGPFVDPTTGEQLRRFYKMVGAEIDEDKIKAICRSGMPLAELNQKLREKYDNKDLTSLT